MSKPTIDAASDAASVLFNLPEYRVVAVTRNEAGGREVFLDTPVTEAGFILRVGCCRPGCISGPCSESGTSRSTGTSWCGG